MTLEEMTKKERERQEKKLRKQLDKQQKVNFMLDLIYIKWIQYCSACYDKYKYVAVEFVLW